MPSELSPTAGQRHRRSRKLRPAAVGVFLGSAAAAMVWGAGVAHAEDGSAPPKDGAGSSTSSARSDAPEPSDRPGSTSGDDDTSVEQSLPKVHAPRATDDEEGDASVGDRAPSAERGRSQRASDVVERRTAGLTSRPTVVTVKSIPVDTPSTTSPVEGASKAVDTEVVSASPARVEPSAPANPVTSVSPQAATVARSSESTDAVDENTTVRVLRSVLPTPTQPVATLPARGPADPVQAAVQLVRQVVGLSFDAGALGASLVNNIALQAAHALGPDFIGGIPQFVAIGVANTAGDLSKVLTGTPLNASSSGRFPVDYGVFQLLSYLTPTAVPAGANDPSIDVTAAHPLPIILVNGTLETQAFNWSVGAPVLANAGYKVFTFNYGNASPDPNYIFQATGDIAQSAKELGAEIDEVLKATKAEKVILIGHSQGGGILPAYYINVLGGASKVSQLIGLAPSNHGTDLDYLGYTTVLPVLGPLLSSILGAVAPAGLQQTITSPFQQVVYGRGDTRPGVLYTNIVTMNDEVVTPYTQQFLSGPNVTNVLVQDLQPGFLGGHIGVVANPAVWSAVLDALSANPAASPLLVPARSPQLVSLAA